ncbi:UDP-galactose transporter senju isoform X2 [Bemisia tabaci]|uniref:UDP-galactose transporter senju isoform X2 n=1 Tax=Bemisia tabaci TaxID=7038 RepID=UPI0008F9B674|nr:PREDICTED: CMP-sialic acid transporter 1 isoform X2 [Bemisia tabaci]
MVCNKISEIFPSRWTVLVFLCYILLFICQGLITTASQEADNKYKYNTTLAVLFTEVIKLFASILLFWRENALSSLWTQTVTHKKLMWLYFVPSLLYCLYNNLSFINLSAYDPTTYFLLLQLRVVITGVVFQVLFKKQLSCVQWISLIVLTLGCMLKEVNFESLSDEVRKKEALNKETGIHLSVHLLLIIVQVLCSCFAGVYNEFLLKKSGADVDIYVQNVFMYFDSIICNLLVLLYEADYDSVFSDEAIQAIFQYKALLVMVNNAAIGIVTSFFLRFLNSILKTFASALELVFIAILSWLIFDIPVRINTALSILVVITAVYLYAQNPVQSPAPALTKTSSTESLVSSNKRANQKINV